MLSILISKDLTYNDIPLLIISFQARKDYTRVNIIFVKGMFLSLPIYRALHVLQKKRKHLSNKNKL